MSYQVIARKWRPKVFKDLIGQDHIAKTLSNSITTSRIAHGYLFAGPRGVGKTSTARIFAKALNCPNVIDSIPCNTCSTCIEITNGNGIDVIEIDGASNNSVDNIRDLRENIRFTPTGGRYKIYIIDEVHMLSKGAFNALLKTLEEPPKHAVFIFATTEIHKVLPTILSRCQRFDFKRIPITLIVETLQKICQEESIQVDQNGLVQVAKKADGSMRDAQSILDQLISFCGNQISLVDVQSVLGIINQDLFFEITQAFIDKNTGRTFSIIEKLFNDGFDLTEVITGLEEHLRHLLVCISTNGTDLIDVADDFKARFMKQSPEFTQIDILRIIEILQKTEQLIRSGSHPQIKLELAFAKICQMDKSIEINELLSNQSSEKKKPQIEVNKTESSENIDSSDQLKSNDLPENISLEKQSIDEPLELTKSTVETSLINSETEIDEAKNEKVVSETLSARDVETDRSADLTSVQSNRTEFNKSYSVSTRKQSEDIASDQKSSTSEDQNRNAENVDDFIDSTKTKQEIKTNNPMIISKAENSIDNQEVEFVRLKWDKLTDDLKTEKPTLAACLSQSYLKELNALNLTIIFDDTAAGKFNLNTFIMNTDFLKMRLFEKTKLQYKFKTSLENFDKSGVEVVTKDLPTIVERLRQKDNLINSAMETFALEAIEFGRKK